MNWFRSKIRSCAQLALFALAFQIAVSFGHMHRDDLGLPPLPNSDSAQTASIAAPAPVANSDRHTGSSQPGSSDDYCPICASMQLIATALPALPPLLLVPEPAHRFWPAQTPTQMFSPQVALSFRARAPPAA
jgi:Protein of unknown function (DUF2946)